MIRITKIAAAGFIGTIGLLFFFDNLFNRARPQEDFNTAKSYAIAAGALGMIVWYGFFVVIGEGYFHMWQTETGLGSVEGAFRYGTVCAVLMFYINTASAQTQILMRKLRAQPRYPQNKSCLLPKPRKKSPNWKQVDQRAGSAIETRSIPSTQKLAVSTRLTKLNNTNSDCCS